MIFRQVICLRQNAFLVFDISLLKLLDVLIKYVKPVHDIFTQHKTWLALSLLIEHAQSRVPYRLCIPKMRQDEYTQCQRNYCPDQMRPNIRTLVMTPAEGACHLAPRFIIYSIACFYVFTISLP